MTLHRSFRGVAALMEGIFGQEITSRGYSSVSSSMAQAHAAVSLAQQRIQPPAYCHVGMDLPPERHNFSMSMPPIRALLVDAAGTLVSPSEKAARVYQRFGRPFGVQLSEPEILHRFRT